MTATLVTNRPAESALPARPGRTGSRRRRLATIGWSALSLVLFALFVFPVYWMVNTSFQPNNEIRGSEIHFWPDNFTLRNYETVLFDPGRTPFLPAAANSLIVTLTTVAVALVFEIFTACMIRDNLTLNVIGLIAPPIPDIHEWQAGAKH